MGEKVGPLDCCQCRRRPHGRGRWQWGVTQLSVTQWSVTQWSVTQWSAVLHSEHHDILASIFKV